MADMDAANTVASLTALLPHDEFEFQLCILDPPKPWTPQWFPTALEPTRVDRQWRFDPIAFQRLRRCIRQFEPHIIHSWDADSHAYGLVAGWFFKHASPKVVWECQPSTRSTYLSRKADRIVSATHAGVSLARQPLQDRCTVIPRGITPSVRQGISRSDLCSQLQIPTDIKLIAAVGPLERRLRWKELIWAIDQLKAVSSPAHLLLIGDGAYRAELNRYIWLNRVNDRVHLLGNCQNWREIVASSDLLWHAGLEVGDRIPILHAQSAGVPVVAVDALGIRDELITHGENGFLTPPTERAGLARWALPILDDENLARRLGMAGRARSEEKWKAEEMVARYAALYRGCI